MIKRIINDKTVEKSELASANGNPNKIFKILFGPERRELFKKYAQEQHRFPVEEDEFGKIDFNDINTWIKPIPGFGKNTYYNESQFDEIVEKLKKQDQDAEESKALAVQQEKKTEEESKESLEQKREEYTEKHVPLKEGPGIKYLGIGGSYRMYKVTSAEGAQQFATPSNLNNVKGWCITGGRGPNYKWSSNHFDSQADRTIDGAFYIFESDNIAKNWAIYILKNNPNVKDKYGNSAPGLAFTPNDTDENMYFIPEECDAPYDKVPELAEYIDVTPRGKGNHALYEDNDGFYRFSGSTLNGIMDNQTTILNIPATFTHVAPSAFSDLHDLVSISFTNTLTSIGSNAFTGCLKLKEVNLKSNNLELGNGVFAYTDIDKINISSVSSIPAKTFHNCKSLKAVEISKNLTSIGKEAFLGCGQLTYLVIPTSCTKIDDNAFFNCKNLVIQTDFEELPSGWYDNIVRHVKEIKFKEKETEENVQDSITNEYIISKKDEDYFYTEYVGLPTWTYYLDNAKLFATKEEAEEKFKTLQIENPDNYRVISVEEYKQSIADSKKLKDSNDLLSDLKEIANGKKNSNGEFVFETDEDIDNVIQAIDKLGYIYTGYEPRKKGHWEYKVFFRDSKLNDINPKEGESKSDFISRFMSETKEEYPDEKQRLAVAYSYWNKKKTKINDSEVYSLWDMFKNPECAGWIFKMDDDPTLCIAMPSNQLGFLEEDEESMSDRLVVEEKLPIKDNLYIFIGHGEDSDVFVTEKFRRNGEELMTIEEAINDIKNSWKSSLNDSEMVINTCSKEKLKDEEISPEEQEVKEIVANFSVQELVKEATEDLKSASNKEELETKYNSWLNKSEQLYNEEKITINQQEEFEDELWDCYKELM